MQSGAQNVEGEGGRAVPDAHMRIRSERVVRAGFQGCALGGPHEEKGDAGEAGVRAQEAEEGAGLGRGECGVEDEEIGAEGAEEGAGVGEGGGVEGESVSADDEAIPGAQAGGVGGDEQDGAIEHGGRIPRGA